MRILDLVKAPRGPHLVRESDHSARLEPHVLVTRSNPGGWAGRGKPSQTSTALCPQRNRGLLDHLRQFLLELGVGFAFVGSQYRLAVGQQEFYIDLLFYHLKLRAYVGIDLKMRSFEPEFAGKIFYLSAVNNLLRHPDDQPSSSAYPNTGWLKVFPKD